MSIKTSYFCDKCNKNIEEGFVFHGSVFKIEKGENVGGIIGDAFDLDETRQKEKVKLINNFVTNISRLSSEQRKASLSALIPKLVTEYHYCTHCNFRILDVHKSITDLSVIKRVQIND